MALHIEIIILITSALLYLIGIGKIIFDNIPRKPTPLSYPQSAVNPKTVRKLFSPSIFLWAGFIVQSIALFYRGYRAEHFPATSIFETMILFSWIISFISLIFSAKIKVPMINAGSFMISVLLILVSFFKIEDIHPLPSVLQSYWLTIHAGFAFLSYAIYTIAFITGIFYILLERQMKSKKFGLLYKILPPLEKLDELNYFSVAMGFIFLTIGIITGAVWAKDAWGNYWSWDPKETWSLISWLLYAVLLHVRITSQFRGRKVAYLSILGFGFILFTYFGVGLLMGGNHSYLDK